METTSNLLVPTPKSVAGFWISAIVLGTGLIFLHGLSASLPFIAAMWRGAVTGIAALIFSVPSLLLLLLLVPWALSNPASIYCWFRLTIAQIISAGITILLLHLVSGHQHYNLEILEIASPHFAAGLLMAYWRYSAWLIRSV